MFIFSSKNGKNSKAYLSMVEALTEARTSKRRLWQIVNDANGVTMACNFQRRTVKTTIIDKGVRTARAFVVETNARCSVGQDEAKLLAPHVASSVNAVAASFINSPAPVKS